MWQILALIWFGGLMFVVGRLWDSWMDDIHSISPLDLIMVLLWFVVLPCFYIQERWEITTISIYLLFYRRLEKVKEKFVWWKYRNSPIAILASYLSTYSGKMFEYRLFGPFESKQQAEEFLRSRKLSQHEWWKPFTMRRGGPAVQASFKVLRSSEPLESVNKFSLEGVESKKTY